MLTAEQLYNIVRHKNSANAEQEGARTNAANALYSLWGFYKKKEQIPTWAEQLFASALINMMEKAERTSTKVTNSGTFAASLHEDVRQVRNLYEGLPNDIKNQKEIKDAADALLIDRTPDLAQYNENMQELLETLIMVNKTLHDMDEGTHPAFAKLAKDLKEGVYTGTQDPEYQEAYNELLEMQARNREFLKATVCTICAMDNLRKKGKLKDALPSQEANYGDDPDQLGPLEAESKRLMEKETPGDILLLMAQMQQKPVTAEEMKKQFETARLSNIGDLIAPVFGRVMKRLEEDAKAVAKMEEEAAQRKAEKEAEPVAGGQNNIQEQPVKEEPQPVAGEDTAVKQQPQPSPQQNTANVRKVPRTDDEEIDLYPHEVLTYGDADEASIQRYEKMFAARAEMAVRAKDILNQTVRIGDTPTENEEVNFENDMAYLFAMDEYRRQNKLSKAFNEMDDLRSLSFKVREGDRMKVLMASTQLKAGGDTSLEKMVRGMVYQGAHQDVVADGIAAASARLNEAKKEEFTRQFEELAQNAMQAKQNLDQLRKGTHEKQQSGELTAEDLAELTDDYTRELRENLVKLITMDNFRRRGTAYLAVEKPRLLQSEADELNRSRKMNSVIHSLVPKSGEGKTLETVFKELRKGTLRNVFAAGGKLVDNTAKPEKKVVTDPKKTGEPVTEKKEEPEQKVGETVTEKAGEPEIKETKEPEPGESEASIFDRVEREFEEPLKAEPGRTSAPLDAAGFGLENEPEEKTEDKVEEKAPGQAKEPAATEPVKQSVQAQPQGPAKTEFHPDSPIMRFQAKLEELRNDIKESKISPLYYLEKEHCREGMALLFTLRDMGKKDPLTPVTKQQVIAHADEIYGDKGKENPEYKMYQDIDNAIRHGVTSMFENVVNAVTGKENNADFVSKVHDSSRVEEWNAKWEKIQEQHKKMNGPVR